MARPKRGGLNIARKGEQAQVGTEAPKSSRKKRFADRTQLTVYLPNDAYRELRMLAAELSRDEPVRMQDLLRRGIDLLFEENDKPRIASYRDDSDDA